MFIRLAAVLLIAGMAEVSPGAIIHQYRASTDVAGNSVWTDEAGTANMTFNTAASPGAAPGSGYFSAAYNFGGSLTHSDVGAGWQNIGAAAAASFEIWLRPTAFPSGGLGKNSNPSVDGSAPRQVLLEFGGYVRGFSLSLDNDGTVLGLMKDVANNSQAPSIIASSAPISGLGASEFIQVVAVYSEPSGNSQLRFYVNGVASGTPVSAGKNLVYSGFDAGGTANIYGGGHGGGVDTPADNPYELPDFTNFLGEIALVRIYNTALSAAQVQQAFESIAVPEPVSLLLVLSGLLIASVPGVRRGGRR